MIKTIISLFSLVVLMSCNHLGEESEKFYYLSERFDDETQFLKNDDLIKNWQSDLRNIPKLDLTYDTETETGYFGKPVLDTLKYWRYQNSYFSFLKEKDNYLTSGGTIKDTIFKIYPDLKIGISKAEFEQILNLEVKRDIVDISDSDNNAMFFFEFKNDKLDNISYEMRID